MPKFICDRISYAISSREYTNEGFLRVPGRVAGAGNVQEYYAKELSITDCDPLTVIKVYRPADEVFKQESLDSYMGADVTDNHPSSMVDSKSYKNVSCGVTVSSGRPDGDFVVADLIIKDEKAIKAVESGKVQLSAGYTADYEKSSGTTPTGEAYDYIQRNIKINHVAIVDAARAGGQARLFDNKGAPKMPIVTLDNGRTVTLDNEANAALISDSLDRMQGIIDTQTQTITDNDKVIKELTAKTSDESLRERVTAVTTAMDSARKVAGRKFSCDSMNVTEIQRQALTSIGRKGLDDKSPAYVQGAFDAAIEAVDASMEEMREKLKKQGVDEDKLKDMSAEEMKDMCEVEDEDKDENNGTKDAHRQFAKDADPTKGQQTNDDAKVSPHQKLKNDRANAWKGKE